MLIVIEELFGITSLPFLHLQFRIKPTLVLKKEQSLRELIEKTKPGFFSTPLGLRPYTLSEELAYFMDASQEFETIVYFYDPDYTSIENLYRIRNILLPDRRLIPIPFDGVKGNRAELIYLIHTLSDWADKQTQHLTYEKFLIHSQYFKSRCTPWSIVAELAPFAEVKKHRTVFQRPSKLSFKQVYAEADGKLKVHKTGELLDLWKQMMLAKTEGKRVWVVRKGVETELPDADFVFDLGNMSLPVNIPYVHAIFAPGK